MPDILSGFRTLNWFWFTFWIPSLGCAERNVEDRCFPHTFLTGPKMINSYRTWACIHSPPYLLVCTILLVCQTVHSVRTVPFFNFYNTVPLYIVSPNFTSTNSMKSADFPTKHTDHAQQLLNQTHTTGSLKTQERNNNYIINRPPNGPLPYFPSTSAPTPTRIQNWIYLSHQLTHTPWRYHIRKCRYGALNRTLI